MPSCPRQIDLRAYGKFHQGRDHWSSHETMVTFRVHHNGSTVNYVECVQVWGQSGKRQSNRRNYAQPDIPDFEDLRQRAWGIFQSRLNGEPRGPRSNNRNRHQDKHHRKQNCEYCS